MNARQKALDRLACIGGGLLLVGLLIGVIHWDVVGALIRFARHAVMTWPWYVWPLAGAAALLWWGLLVVLEQITGEAAERSRTLTALSGEVSRLSSRLDALETRVAPRPDQDNDEDEEKA